MTQHNVKATLSKAEIAGAAKADQGIISADAGYRFPPAEITDSGRIRFGDGYRLPIA